MKYFRLPFVVVLIALLILGAGCLRRRDRIPAKKESLKGSGKLYFVPLGDFPAATANELASFYRKKYGLHVETLPNVQLAPVAINEERQQLIAEGAVEIMKQANPNLKNDPQAILIGLTDQDMYIASLDWEYGFSFRDEGKYAVVSSGRMNIPVIKKPASEELIQTRMRKMVTKNVGILYYHLSQNDHPRSVLYRKVGGIRELDYMGEEF